MNVIVDCLLAEMLDGLKNKEFAECKVLGKLPDDLPMEDEKIDLSITSKEEKDRHGYGILQMD